MSGMKWLKYYTGVLEENDEVAAVLEKFGHDGYGKYWHLMGMLGKKFSEDSDTILLTNRFLRECLRFKSKKKLKDFLLSTEMKTIFNTIEIDGDFLFDSSILLELKSRDFKATRSQRKQKAYKNKNKIKNKKESKNTYLDAFELLQFWNGLGMKTHEPKPETLRSINEAYQFKSSHGINGNKQAFANYASVLKDPNAWWTAIFSCEGFLKNSGTERFYEPEFNHAEYIKSKPITGSKGSAQARQENLANMEFTENDFA